MKRDGGGEPAQEHRHAALELRELEEAVLPVETPPDISREVNGREQLGAHGSDSGAAHPKRRIAELPEDEDVIQDDVGDDQDGRRREEGPRSSQADQQRAVGESRARERDAVGIDLKVVVDGSTHSVRFDEPCCDHGRQQLERRRQRDADQQDEHKALVKSSSHPLGPALTGSPGRENLDSVH